MIRKNSFIKFTLLLIFSLFLITCSENLLNSDKEEMSNIQMNILVTDDEQRVDGHDALRKSAVITRVTVTVTGPGISAITKDLTENGQGSFSGTIEVSKGNERTFMVEAKDAANIVQYEGAASKNIQADNESVSLTLTPIYPNAVTLSLVGFSAESVTLSWTKSYDSDYNFYRLVRSIDNSFDINNDPYMDIDNINTLGFTNTLLTSNTPYYYKLYVVDTELLAMGSNTITVTTAAAEAPSGLAASSNNGDHITLTWNSAAGASEYKIYRDTLETGSYPLTYSTAGTSFDDDAVDQARFYYYRVSAVFGSGSESEISGNAAGYRTGWRFSSVTPYADAEGFGNEFDLRAYGYNGLTRVLGFYAIYDDGAGNYFYVPGSGQFDYAAKIENRNSSYNETVWFGGNIKLTYAAWDAGYKNNTFEQYMVMEIYKSGSISSFSEDSYDFYIFSINWNSNINNNPTINILKQLSDGDAKKIKKQIQENPQIDYQMGSKDHNVMHYKKRILQPIEESARRSR